MMADQTIPLLVFEISGKFAHYKRIFATTSALSYPAPTKTALYGLVAAILGLEKEGNAYLKTFAAGQCRMGIQLINPVKRLSMTVNLRPAFGSNSAKPGKKSPYRKSGNRKPTLTEFIYEPRFRIFFYHTDEHVRSDLRSQLAAGRSVYTPTLGTANLLGRINYLGEGMATRLTNTGEVDVHGVIPKSKLAKLAYGPNVPHNHLVEVGQVAIEMETTRDVTVRDGYLLDRFGKTIRVTAEDIHRITWNKEVADVILF